MNIFQFFFLACFKICTCFNDSIFYDNRYFEETIKDYPFTIIIVKNGPPKNIHSFGTLIHEKAVLTYQTKDTDKQLYFNSEASAGCSFITLNRDYFALNCSQHRSITEYNVIDMNTEEYIHRNMVILVLSKPFELNKRVHQVKLAHYSEDYDPTNCRILYYMRLTYFNPSNSIRFAYPIEIVYLGRTTRVLVDISQMERTYDDRKTELFGSPVVCRSNIQGAEWVQLPLLHINLNPTNISNFELFENYIPEFYQIFEEIRHQSIFY